MGPALPAAAYAVALVSLPELTPARAAALVGDGTDAADRLDAVRAGRAAEIPQVADRLAEARAPERLVATWAEAARAIDPDALWSAHRLAGVGVATRSSAAFPEALLDDPQPPAVLFHVGDLDVLAGHRVAIVGTRTCTQYGRDVAYSFGHDLATGGVAVVSGLALGIDGAAHRGVLAAEAAPPIGVVACGLDIAYPRRHATLLREVRSRGVVLGEHPLGRPPLAAAFPWRNRIIAALADVVVIVESHVTGGSLHTASQADRRGRTVLAVPGPVTSAASTGTNGWIADHPGPSIARDVTDVFVALGLAVPRRSAAERRPPPTPDDARVLDALGWQPATLEQLALRTGGPVAALAVALDRLRCDGWISERGGWFERIGRDRRGAPSAPDDDADDAAGHVNHDR